MVLLSMQNIMTIVDQWHPMQKLTSKYIGLFKIIQVISSIAYKLELPENIKMYLVFYILLLKKYKTSEEFAWCILLPPIISDAKEEEYKVEDILDKKIIKQCSHYLIK